MANVSDKALDIVAQKPRFWEHKFFAQVLTDEIAQCAEERKKHRKGQPSLPKFSIEEQEFPSWMSSRMQEQQRRVSEFSRALGLWANLSFGDDGAEADVTFMAELARELSKAYCDAIQWSQGFRSLSLPLMYQPCLKEAAAYSDNYISGIESLPERVLEQISDFEQSGQTGRLEINMIINVAAHNSEALHRENEALLEKYRRKFNIFD